jgi:putative ABC transport system permease protein
MREFYLAYRESMRIAYESLTLHKTRSMLTMLGIIFGVGAVIAMLSIGEGARQESLEQIEVLGVRNVIIRSAAPPEATDDEQAATRPYGISLKDAEAITSICSFAERTSVSWESTVDVRTYEGKTKATLIGTTGTYASIFNLRLSDGHFLHEAHLTSTANVCVIGSEVKQALFGFKDAIGKLVKIQDQWFTVVGVLQRKNAARMPDVQSTPANETVLIPLTTAMAKFPRAAGEEQSTRRRGRRFRSSDNESYLDRSTIDQIAVQISADASITEAARVIEGIIRHRHNGQTDFTVTIPEVLIEQSQKTQSIFNIVMGAIAGISLIVGGIGIMNIMLASVLERTREIGIRRAIGATRAMIIVQFLTEAVLLSIAGGVIGIATGWGMTVLITVYAGWRTIMSVWAIGLAFTVAAATGILFGYYPARRAAEADIIDALRYE